MPNPAFDPIPDAVGAVIAAVIEDNPFAPPHRQAVLVVRALRRDGWRVVAPAGRATKTAVGGLPEECSALRSAQNGSQGR